MEDNGSTTVPSTTPNRPQLPPPTGSPMPDESALIEKENRKRTILLIAIAVLIVGALIAFAWFLMRPGNETVAAQFRDVFIIFMALESLVIGAALVILITQMSILINLIQNELKPILTSTNDTVSTLRGTVVFLSDNLVEPVMKMNEYLAGIKRLSDLFRGGRK